MWADFSPSVFLDIGNGNTESGMVDLCLMSSVALCGGGLLQGGELPWASVVGYRQFEYSGAVDCV